MKRSHKLRIYADLAELGSLAIAWAAIWVALIRLSPSSLWISILVSLALGILLGLIGSSVSSRLRLLSSQEEMREWARTVNINLLDSGSYSQEELPK